MTKPLKLQRIVQSTIGALKLQTESYLTADGPLAVLLVTLDGKELVTKLSVNLDESKDLPENCFYLKWWSENYEIAGDALASGWLKPRYDLPLAKSGLITAIPVMEVLDLPMTPNEIHKMVDEWASMLSGSTQ